MFSSRKNHIMAERSGGLGNIVSIFIGDKLTIITCSVVCSISIITSLIFSWMLGLVVIGCFVIGIFLPLFISRPNESVPNFLFMLNKNELITNEVKETVCSVCGDEKCKRHVSSKNFLVQWSRLQVPEEVDNSLEDLLNVAINEYVYTWYSEMSEDESFILEIKATIRHFIALLYYRIRKVDIVKLITEKLLKAALIHLDCYVHATRRLSSSHSSASLKDVESAFFRYCGDNVHIAVQNRKCELNYLQQLCHQIFKFVLPPRTIDCRSVYIFLRELLSYSMFLPAMDVLANPDNINDLLLLLFDKDPMVIYPDAENHVELLRSFASPNSNNIHSSILNTNLQLILNNNQLFYSFMTFLKKEGLVHLLQFCMSVEDFNKKILGPDWEIQDLNELKKDMKRIYNTYCCENSSDMIKFDDRIVQEVKEILDGNTEDMLKFHTSDVMLVAYDHVYYMLENICCPAYYHSCLYFSLICGNRHIGKSNKSSSRGSKKEASAVSKLGNKIKDVFKVSTVDGHMDLSFAGQVPVLAEAVFAEEDLNCTLTSEMIELTSELRDLSAWRLTIPRVESRMDVHNKQYYVFVIDVQRIDVSNVETTEQISWTIERKYHEFYALEMKLIEFHGELNDVHLPPKRSFTTKKTMEFMQKNIAPFQIFLQKLIVQPSFRGSQLLYNFLTSRGEFTTSFLPDIGLGKMFKTVPMKLRKEKGQNLESFLYSFMLSTEQVKPNQGNLDWKDVFEEPIPTAGQKIINDLYGDNAGVDINFISNTSPSVRCIMKVSGIFDYVLYLFYRIFDCPQWFIHLLLTVKLILKTSLETLYIWYLEKKLRLALKPRRVAQIIDLIKDTIFHSKENARSEEQKLERKKQVYHEAKEFLPELFSAFIGDKGVNDGLDIILSALQHPKLNKQLSYVLLDIVVIELFPETSTSGG